MPNNQLFIVFSDDWGVHPSSCQHIFKIIAKKHQIIWVNTIGTREPTLSIYDFQKAITKIRKMLFPDKQHSTLDNDNIIVIQPLMLPFFSLPGIKSINKFSVIRAVKKTMKNIGMINPINVITAPNAHEYIGHLNEIFTVYYSVDDFSEWPGLNKNKVQAMEMSLIKKSDVFIASSTLLIKRIENFGKEAHLLTHGVELSLFTKPVLSEHKLLKNIPHPRIGYFGLFDGRSDINLLLDISSRLPSISIIITGEIETDIHELQNKTNIYFTGKIPYSEIPQMAHGWDICILPYKINRLTDAMQPLKIKEYLATGKPIISTPLNELKVFSNYIYLADTTEKWIQAIEMILDGKQDKDKQIDYIKKESWESKASIFMDIVCEYKKNIKRIL
jgi:glycosyltransferase involved in cell wall biosynthesis